MFLLAEIPAADPSMVLIVQVLQGLGVPGSIIIILGYTLRKIVLWGTPWMEKIFAAHVQRQEVMAEQSRRLTDGCLEIQQKNADVLADLNLKLPALCRVRPPGGR